VAQTNLDRALQLVARGSSRRCRPIDATVCRGWSKDRQRNCVSNAPQQAQLNIYAPATGYVAALGSKPGQQIVGAGSPALFTISGARWKLAQ
jgi:multidrug resistance efflux pump